MKTYQQVIQQAVLNGAHYYYVGDGPHRGAHAFVDAATFIYGVSRDQFFDDFEELWDDVRQRIEVDHMHVDDVIKYIQNIC